MSLQSYAFVFSLQEDEENVTFDELLQPDDETCEINQEEFDGFSYGVPQVSSSNEGICNEPQLWQLHEDPRCRKEIRATAER